MDSLICCYGARSWTRGIAWIQIVLFAVGLFLSVGGLIALLVAGKDAVDKVTHENPSHGNGASSDWNLASSSEYLTLVLDFSMSVLILVLGIILAVFLLKGATESKSRYLKWWVIYSVICVAWFILTEVIFVRVDKIFALLRISVCCSYYGFCIFVVVTLIRDIDHTTDAGTGTDQDKGKTAVEAPGNNKMLTSQILIRSQISAPPPTAVYSTFV